MSSLRAIRLGFAHTGAVVLLEDASFHLTPGWVGLVGPNGAGKTTLLRLLAGEIVSDQGCIVTEPDPLRIVLCPQLVEAPGDREADLARSTDASASRLRGELGLDPAALERWPSLSPGERKRWQIGAALFEEPDVLLLDEPTNHLDDAARKLLVRALERFRGIGVVVSHDRALLEALTRSTLRLDGGRARLWPGAYGEARAAWEAEELERRDAREHAAVAARAAERRLQQARRDHLAAKASLVSRSRMKDARDHDARGALAKGRAENAERTIGRQVGVARRKAERATAAVERLPVTEPLGRAVFVGYERAARPRLLSFDGTLRAGGRELVANVHVALERDGRVHLVGPNGAGKSTLLRAMLDGSTLPPDKILHLPQEVGAAAARAAQGEVRRLSSAERGRTLSLVAALGVDPARLLASAQPSPGEARKLLIALGLGRHVWALVLDEPTNHLDLPSIERLEEALAGFPGALLLVTHDREFARRSTRATWAIEAGALVRS